MIPGQDVTDQLRHNNITRARIVAEARSWIRTPYRKRAMVKGAGCDCATLLLGVLQAVGIAADETVGEYSANFWMAATDETYLLRLMRFAQKVGETRSWRAAAIEPGNLVLCRAVGSRRYNHGGIATAWPLVVHATREGVCESDASQHWLWAGHEVAVLDPLVMEKK